jgi:hypothetical protein
MSKLASLTTSLPKASIQNPENLPNRLTLQPPAANGCLEKLRDCVSRFFQKIANFFARIFCAGSKKQEIPQNLSQPSLPKLEDNKKLSAKAKIDNPPVSQAKSLSVPEQNIQKKPTQVPTSLQDESTPSIPRKKPVAQPVIVDRTLPISNRPIAQDEPSSVEIELPKRPLPTTSPIVASQAVDDKSAPTRVQVIPRQVSKEDQAPIIATSTKSIAVAEQNIPKRTTTVSFHVPSVPLKKDEPQPQPVIADRALSLSTRVVQDEPLAREVVSPKKPIQAVSIPLATPQPASVTNTPVSIPVIPRQVSKEVQTPSLATSTKSLAVAEQSIPKRTPTVPVSIHVPSFPLKKDGPQPQPVIADRALSVSNSAIATAASRQIKLPKPPLKRVPLPGANPPNTPKTPARYQELPKRVLDNVFYPFLGEENAISLAHTNHSWNKIVREAYFSAFSNIDTINVGDLILICSFLFEIDRSKHKKQRWDYLVDAIPHLSSLRVLNLDEAPPCFIEKLASAIRQTKGFPKLVALNPRNGFLPSKSLAEIIHSLPHLQNFAGDSLDDTLMEALSHCHDLRTLTAISYNAVDQNKLETWAKNWPKLDTVGALVKDDQNHANRCVCILAKNCPSLRFIAVSDLDKQIISALVPHCLNLEELTLCTVSAPIDEESIPENLRAIYSQLPEDLRAQMRGKLTPEVIKELRFPKLKKVAIPGAGQSKRVAEHLIDYHPGLESFSINSADNNPAMVRRALTKLPSLKILGISLCKEGSFGIPSNARYGLTFLSLMGYEGTDEDLAPLLKALPHLEYLDLSTCNRLTDKTLLLIAKHCPHLKYLNNRNSRIS